MSAADIILLLIFGFAAYRGYQKGLLVSLLSILAFIISLIAAFAFLDWGVDLLDDHIEGLSGILPFLAFILIFGLVALLINLGGQILKKTIDLTLIGSLDNLAGAVLGVIKWVFGLSLLIWLSQAVGYEIPVDWHGGSLLYNQIEPVAPNIIDMFSEYFPFLKSLFESIRERLQPSIP